MTDNIYTWYEQNIGIITPLLAEKLKDAEAEYPPDWIREAMEEAVKNNVRRWSYVSAILERWRREGKGGSEPQRDYLRGLPEYEAEERQGEGLQVAAELAREWYSFFTGFDYCQRVILPHMAPRRREAERVVVETDSEYWAEYGANRFAKGLERWYGMPVVFECALTS